MLVRRYLGLKAFATCLMAGPAYAAVQPAPLHAQLAAPAAAVAPLLPGAAAR
ncbi:MAG: hypothetical protein ACJ798_19335 [Phenylobacterium sp.]